MDVARPVVQHIATRPKTHYRTTMTKLQAMQREAIILPPEDRAALVTVLLGTFDGPDYDVSDDEVARRKEEMVSGAEPGIDQKQFLRGIRRLRCPSTAFR